MDKNISYPNGKSVRDFYVEYGVDQYYKEFGATYKNPHEDRVKHSLKSVFKKWTPNTTKVLDLAAGSGEVTLFLQSIGLNNIEGIDPYTYKAYEKRTKLPCKPLKFEDIVNGELANEKYSLIICSYAMHLADDSILPVLCMQLAMISQELMILSPHKRPVIKSEWGWNLENEETIDRTHIKYYKSNMYIGDNQISGGQISERKEYCTQAMHKNISIVCNKVFLSKKDI